MLLAGGADIQTVKARLGHGSLRTTEEYLHTVPDTDNTALDALQPPESAHRGRFCTPFASASAALSAHTRPYRQGVTAEGSLSMRELFGHRVELPS